MTYIQLHNVMIFISNICIQHICNPLYILIENDGKRESIMYETSTLKEKLKLFSTILIRILITQVSMYLMNCFDTVMSGQAGAEDLAGVASAASLGVPVCTGVSGMMLARTPTIAQLTGANKHAYVAHKIQQAISLSVAMALTIMFVIFVALRPILHVMDLEPSVRHIATYYLVSISTGIVPLFVFNTLRSFI